MLRPYGLLGHNVDSCRRWPLVQRQDTRLWIWEWWFESTGANSPWGRTPSLSRHAAAEVGQRECVDIGDLGDHSVRGPIAVASRRLHPNERGPGAALRCLERRCELERMTGHHPVIVVGGGDERGRVARARLQVVQRR